MSVVREPETTRLTIIWSKEADAAVRSYLGAQGKNESDLSRFIEEAVRWRIFRQTVDEARTSFSDVSPEDLQSAIDEAVDDVRGQRYRQTASQD